MTARLGQLLEFTGKKEGGLEPEFEPREALPRRQTLGELLRQTRERYRQDLETVSAELRIRLVYLRAIEDDCFDLLPGPTYASGFLRSYAEYLGLNSKDVIRRYREEMAQISANEQSAQAAEVVERRFPVRAAVVGVLALAAVGVGWRFLSGSEDGVLGTIAGIPGRIEALIAGPEPAIEALPVGPAATVPETDIAAMLPAREATPVGGSGSPQRGPFGVFAPAPVAEPVEISVSVIAANGLPVPPTKPAMPTDAAALAPSAVPALTVAADDPAAPSAQATGTAVPQPVETDAAAIETAPVPAPAPEPTIPAAPSAAAAAAPPAPDVAAAAPAAPAVPDTVATGSSTAATGGSSNLNALAAIPAVPSDALNGTRSQTFGATNAGSRVLLYARLESWIQVTDAENVPLWTRVLRAGDSYLLPDQPGLTLATGNAGGLDIFVDGKKIPSLGPVGVERRGVFLDPARLTTGTAAP